MNCTNCRTKLGCGCQKRVASDGTSVCASCITNYETNIKQSQTSSSGTSPSNVKVFYNAPKK